MKNLYDTATYNEIVSRMETLSHHSQRQWGKMEVAQMLAHCQEGFKVVLSDKPLKRSLLGILLGWAFKSQLYNDKPWKQGLPTAPNFVIKDKRAFDEEYAKLKSQIDAFYTRGPQQSGKYPHPMFGRFTPEQWGQAMYKHLDHHFRQFSA